MTLVLACYQQAESCARMGSHFTAQVLEILANNWDDTTRLGQALAAFVGDLGPAGHSLPLRLTGGLHHLVLSGRDTRLSATYPPNIVAHATLEDAIVTALKLHEDFFLTWIKSAPQTNEIRRSAALIAMAHTALSHFDRPIVLSELGASGGLNLMWDRYALKTNGWRIGPQKATIELAPEWSGPPVATACPQIVDRLGVDLNPLDLRSKSDRLRLLSYLWADQPFRATLTKRAISALAAKVERGDAIDWLQMRLEQAPKGYMHVIQHSVAWQYFPEQSQHRGQELIEAAGAKATEHTPLAWMQMETDGDATGAIGAALTLRLWPGDLTLDLGRADFHGRWMNWTG